MEVLSCTSTAGCRRCSPYICRGDRTARAPPRRVKSRGCWSHKKPWGWQQRACQRQKRGAPAGGGARETPGSTAGFALVLSNRALRWESSVTGGFISWLGHEWSVEPWACDLISVWFSSLSQAVEKCVLLPWLHVVKVLWRECHWVLGVSSPLWL